MQSLEGVGGGAHGHGTVTCFQDGVAFQVWFREEWPQLSTVLSLLSSDCLILRNRNSFKEMKVNRNFYCQYTEDPQGIQCNSWTSWDWNVVNQPFSPSHSLELLSPHLLCSSPYRPASAIEIESFALNYFPLARGSGSSSS